MRFMLSACCFACVFTVFISQGSANHHRQKRFLHPETFRLLPENLFRIGDIARGLSESLSSHATVGVHSMMPQVPMRREELVPQQSKRRLVKTPSDRETEGDEKEFDEKEVETFDSGEVERPSKPSEEPEGINPFNFPFSISFGLFTPWWNGPNTCVERNEVDEAEKDNPDIPGMNFNMESTQCIPSESTYICTKKIQTNGMRKTIVVRRQCCHGYIRRNDGRPGCSALKMENLIDTMKSLDVTRFVQLVESAGMKERLQNENLTVFSPSNDAIIDFEDETEDNEISAINPARRYTEKSSVVGGHIAEGFINVDIVENDHLLHTLNGKSTIRINKYQPAHTVVTANCVPITGKNNFATNGIVHMMSGVLPLPKKTVGDIIETESQYSAFKKLLSESDLLEELKKEDKVWTAFVPTNEAFENADIGLKKQMESGEACVESILKQHVVKGTVCTSAVVSQARVKNLLENILKMTRDEAENMRMDGVLLTSIDNVGTNGVVHALEKILVPPQARSLLKALEDGDRTDLLELIETADLASTFDGMKNVTFFAPSREALKNLKNATLEELQSNPDLLREVLLHHIAEPRTPASSLADNKNLLAADGQKINIKLHELFPGIVTGATAQCAYIVNHDNQACGAVIHQISKVIWPSKGNVLETLKEMDSHQIVYKMLQGTDLEVKLKENGPFTFLAPTDESFESFSKKGMDELLSNKTKAEEILKLHVLPEMLCCSNVNHGSPFHRQFVRTYDGSLLPLHRGLHERIRFGRARAVKCDIPATNGLVHSINKLILPQRPSIFGMELWPIL